MIGSVGGGGVSPSLIAQKAAGATGGDAASGADASSGAKTKSKRDQQAESALSSLKAMQAGGAKSSAAQKAAARARLDRAKQQLHMLRMVGGDPRSVAQQAARIAKEIAAAAKEYAAAGGAPADAATSGAATNAPAAAKDGEGHAGAKAGADAVAAADKTAGEDPAQAADKAQQDPGAAQSAAGGKPGQTASDHDKNGDKPADDKAKPVVDQTAASRGKRDPADLDFIREARALAKQAKAALEHALRDVKKGGDLKALRSAGTDAEKAVDQADKDMAAAAQAGGGLNAAAAPGSLVSILV